MDLQNELGHHGSLRGNPGINLEHQEPQFDSPDRLKGPQTNAELTADKTFREENGSSDHRTDDGLIGSRTVLDSIFITRSSVHTSPEPIVPETQAEGKPREATHQDQPDPDLEDSLDEFIYVENDSQDREPITLDDVTQEDSPHDEQLLKAIEDFLREEISLQSIDTEIGKIQQEARMHTTALRDLPKQLNNQATSFTKVTDFIKQTPLHDDRKAEIEASIAQFKNAVQEILKISKSGLKSMSCVVKSSEEIKKHLKTIDQLTHKQQLRKKMNKPLLAEMARGAYYIGLTPVESNTTKHYTDKTLSQEFSRFMVFCQGFFTAYCKMETTEPYLCCVCVMINFRNSTRESKVSRNSTSINLMDIVKTFVEGDLEKAREDFKSEFFRKSQLNTAGREAAFKLVPLPIIRIPAMKTEEMLKKHMRTSCPGLNSLSKKISKMEKDPLYMRLSAGLIDSALTVAGVTGGSGPPPETEGGSGPGGAQLQRDEQPAGNAGSEQPTQQGGDQGNGQPAGDLGNTNAPAPGDTGEGNPVQAPVDNPPLNPAPANDLGRFSSRGIPKWRRQGDSFVLDLSRLPEGFTDLELFKKPADDDSIDDEPDHKFKISDYQLLGLKRPHP